MHPFTIAEVRRFAVSTSLVIAIVALALSLITGCAIGGYL